MGIDRLMRELWTNLTEEQLLAQCEVDTYRASGPGGQKRNKTSSAVRLRHLPSGLIVIAEESRSQHENKAKALKRLQRAFVLEIREPIAPENKTREKIAQHPHWAGVPTPTGKLYLGVKDKRFWKVAALILDLMVECESRVSDVANYLGISTGNLINFLETDSKVWQEANNLRMRFGQKVLRISS